MREDARFALTSAHGFEARARARKFRLAVPELCCVAAQRLGSAGSRFGCSSGTAPASARRGERSTGHAPGSGCG